MEKRGGTGKATQEPPVEFRESKRQPTWHVFVLHILTLSAYSLVWYYKNVRDLNEYAKERASKDADAWQDASAVIKRYEKTQPLLRSIGLIVPLLQFYLIGQFFKDCAELYPDGNSVARKQPLLCGIALTVLIGGLFWLYKLPGAFFLLYLSSVIPMAIAQFWLNSFWATVEDDDLLVRHAFSAGELVSIICGSMALGLVVVSFFIGR